jgi:hypothetical protein
VRCWKRWWHKVSDRSQEYLNEEDKAASAEQARVLSDPALVQSESLSARQANSIALPLPANPVEIQDKVVFVPPAPAPAFPYPAGQFVQNTGTFADTDNNSTAVFTIPVGKAPAPGNTIIGAICNTNTTPGSTVINSITLSRAGNPNDAFWATYVAPSLTGPSINIVAIRCADMREGDTITFGWPRNTDKVAGVLAEFLGMPYTSSTGNDFANGTSTTPATPGHSFAKDSGYMMYAVGVANNGTQAITPDSATDPTNSEPMRYHGRATTGTFSAELFTSGSMRQSYSFTSTLPASAEWSARAATWVYDFR